MKLLRHTFLFFLVAATLCASCGEKEDDTQSPPTDGNYPATVASTKWELRNAEGVEPREVILFFGKSDDMSRLTISHWESNADIYQGPYSYDSGEGTLSVEHLSTHTAFTGTFTVSANSLTLSIAGATYSLNGN